VTDLEAGTEITLAQMRVRKDGSGKAIAIRQHVGRTYHRVEPLLDSDARFEVETPQATATVRGTAFSVEVEANGTTSIAVDEGIVHMTAQGVTVEIVAGRQAQVRPGQPPVLAQPTATPRPTETPTPEPSPAPTQTPEPTVQERTPQSPVPTQTADVEQQTGTPVPSNTDDSANGSKTLQPPGLTKTPQPPGLTKTPQPPGLTKTAQPPGLTKTPEHPEKPDKPDRPDKPDKPGKPKK
jgi:hypothetical protein